MAVAHGLTPPNDTERHRRLSRLWERLDERVSTAEGAEGAEVTSVDAALVRMILGSCLVGEGSLALTWRKDWHGPRDRLPGRGRPA